jgi:hypothetical protein
MTDATEETIAEDEALYDAATEPEPVAEEPVVAEGRQRDEKGRFAPKQEEEPVAEAAPEPVAVQPEPEKVDHRIPLTELLNEREKRQAEQRRAEQLMRELETLRQQLQPQRQAPQAPDQFQDPEGYNAYWEHRLQEQQTHFQQAMRGVQAENSLARAHDKHGEVFEKAYQAVMDRASQGDRSIAQQMVNSPNPGESIVAWYKRESTLQMVGDDPEAFLNKKLEEKLNDPEFLAKAIERARGVASTQPTQVKLPPSLNKVAAASRADDGATLSDAGLYHHAIGR